ncbi:hypothetical protein OHS70_34115 [Streptomyces sp. NBC_00390]|uniref:hypothetical protein n=1 Tax=Streptomyces sp. NBC_00390 TaxID=2975736 RepID=UPI002E1DC666
MQDLTHRIRALLSIDTQDEYVSVPLGGGLFDVIVTAGGPAGHAAVAHMDQVRLGICGPVIEDPEQSYLLWLVPPSTSTAWPLDPCSVAFGAPWALQLPRLNLRNPPGPHWLRECRSDRLVPPQQLRRLIDQGHLAALRDAAVGAPLHAPVSAGG